MTETRCSTLAGFTCVLVTMLCSLCASAAELGWVDCGSAVSPSAVHKAWRSMALASHPDKNPHADGQFEGTTELRDALKADPMRFRLQQLFSRSRRGSLQPFLQRVRGSVFENVLTTAEYRDDWPYLRMDATVTLPRPLEQGSHFVLSFGVFNHSSIHYRGDKAGYCVCCNLVKHSRCKLLPSSKQTVDLQYETHDCPLGPGGFNISVSRPLHVVENGLWGAVLVLLDRSHKEVACLSAAFSLHATDKPNVSETASRPSPNSNSSDNSSNCSSEGHQSPPHVKENPRAVKFVQYSSGSVCQDGGDLLEGAVDDWSACEPHPLLGRICSMTNRCREKCRRKKSCQFYSIFRSGWCQLSSRCEQTTPSGKAGQVLIGIISLPEPGGRSLAIMAAFQFFVAAAEWKIMSDPAGSAIHSVIGLMLAVAWTKRHGAPTAGVNCERSKSS